VGGAEGDGAQVAVAELGAGGDDVVERGPVERGTAGVDGQDLDGQP
jgi:hypothetical protein